MASLVKTKKKSKITFEIPEEDENKPLINVNSYDQQGVSEESTSQPRHETPHLVADTVPSAPNKELYEPIGLCNPRIRNQFLQKVYLAIMAHLSTSAFLILLFVKIPHLRKIFRKNFFDRLFLSSIIGLPLCVFMILLLVFPKLRRKYSWITMIILTASLSLLVSYAITEATANAFLYSIGASDLCCLSAIISSSSKRVNFTNWKMIASIPAIMIISSVLAPSILRTQLSNTIGSSIMATILMTYLSANTRPVIRFNDLQIEDHEYLFAATQLYLHPEQAIRHRIKNLFSANRRRAYNEI